MNAAGCCIAEKSVPNTDRNASLGKLVYHHHNVIGLDSRLEFGGGPKDGDKSGVHHGTSVGLTGGRKVEKVLLVSQVSLRGGPAATGLLLPAI